MKKKIIYPHLSYRIMQAVFEVHNQLGPGFVESVYEEALVRELTLLQIPHQQQQRITYFDQLWYAARAVSAYCQLVHDECHKLF